MIIFNGDKLATKHEQDLAQEVNALREQGIVLKIAAILFTEDQGSQLYTRLKSEAAARVGIEYEVFEFSLQTNVELVLRKLAQLNQDPAITGIIIQKPWRKTWVETKGIATDKSPKAIRQAFNAWWELLTADIKPEKDVDGLHPETLAAIKTNTWQEQKKVLPATAWAILVILKQALAQLKIEQKQQRQLQVLVLGRSEIVGQPVFYELCNQGFQVKLLTRDDVLQRLNSKKMFLDAEVIISATGSKHLIKGEMIKAGAIVIDVGEPRPDVDLASIKDKAAFITPVPGGVGPMTVVSLLKNCVTISSQ